MSLEPTLIQNFNFKMSALLNPEKWSSQPSDLQNKQTNLCWQLTIVDHRIKNIRNENKKSRLKSL